MWNRYVYYLCVCKCLILIFYSHVVEDLATLDIARFLVTLLCDVHRYTNSPIYLSSHHTIRVSCILLFWFFAAQCSLRGSWQQADTYLSITEPSHPSIFQVKSLGNHSPLLILHLLTHSKLQYVHSFPDLRRPTGVILSRITEAGCH